MARDVTRLIAFREADALLDRVYRATQNMPVEERYGLQAQIRRASISVTCNLIEGSGRRSTKEFLRFVEIARGSASENAYLLQLAARLSLLPPRLAKDLSSCYIVVVRRLQKLIMSLESEP